MRANTVVAGQCLEEMHIINSGVDFKAVKCNSKTFMINKRFSLVKSCKQIVVHRGQKTPQKTDICNSLVIMYLSYRWNFTVMGVVGSIISCRSKKYTMLVNNYSRCISELKDGKEKVLEKGISWLFYWRTESHCLLQQKKAKYQFRSDDENSNKIFWSLANTSPSASLHADILTKTFFVYSSLLLSALQSNSPGQMRVLTFLAGFAYQRWDHVIALQVSSHYNQVSSQVSSKYVQFRVSTRGRQVSN